MSAKPENTIIDPFLSRLDGLQQGLNQLRDTYLMMRYEMQEAAQNLANPSSELLTAKELARITQIPEISVRNGAAGTDCLYRARIKDGRSVRYPRRLVDIHQDNRERKGFCGTCDSEYRKRGDHLTRIK